MPLGFDAGVRVRINPSVTWSYRPEPIGPATSVSGLPTIAGVSFYIVIPVAAVLGHGEAYGYR